MDCPFKKLAEPESDDDDDHDDDDDQDQERVPVDVGVREPRRPKPKVRKAEQEKEMKKEHDAGEGDAPTPVVVPRKDKNDPTATDTLTVLDVLEEVKRIMSPVPPEIRGEPAAFPGVPSPVPQPKAQGAQVSIFDLVTPAEAPVWASVPKGLANPAQGLARATADIPQTTSATKTTARFFPLTRRRQAVVPDVPKVRASSQTLPMEIFEPTPAGRAVLREVIGDTTPQFSRSDALEDFTNGFAAFTVVAVTALTLGPLIAAGRLAQAAVVPAFMTFEEEIAQGFAKAFELSKSIPQATVDVGRTMTRVAAMRGFAFGHASASQNPFEEHLQD